MVLSFELPQEGYTAIDGVIEFRVYPFEAQYCRKPVGISGFTLEGTLLQPTADSSEPWDLTDEICPNIIYYGWTLGSGTSPLENDDVIAFSICNEAALSSLDIAIEEEQYASVSLEPALGWSMNLGSAAAEVTIRRLNNHGGHQYAVFSSIGGFNSGDEIFISEYYDFWSVKDVVLSFALPQEGYTAIDGVIEFRVYPFEAQYCRKPVGISGFTLEGTLY